MALTDVDSIEDVNGTLPIENNDTHLNDLQTLLKEKQELNERLEQIEAKLHSNDQNVITQTQSYTKKICFAAAGGFIIGACIIFTYMASLMPMYKV